MEEKEQSFDETLKELTNILGFDIEDIEVSEESKNLYIEMEQKFLSYNLCWDTSSIEHLISRMYLNPKTKEYIIIDDLVNECNSYMVYLLILIGTNPENVDKDANKARKIVVEWGEKGWSYEILHNLIVQYMHYSNGFFHQGADMQMIILMMQTALKKRDKIMLRMLTRSLIESITNSI
jgi:hypothetical protein